ncbi:hypothetical protein LMG22931_01330 [Paraburkholderia nemoris]|nr:hypothetical protein LMG22931_01330 [Paraburkholderia nemoris]
MRHAGDSLTRIARLGWPRWSKGLSKCNETAQNCGRITTTT